jgi:hypothetical protein
MESIAHAQRHMCAVFLDQSASCFHAGLKDVDKFKGEHIGKFASRGSLPWVAGTAALLSLHRSAGMVHIE